MEKVIKQETLETKYYITKILICVDQNPKKPYYKVYQLSKDFDNVFHFVRKFDNYDEIHKIIW